jgi:DNA-3-methyladenine glycosylase II
MPFMPSQLYSETICLEPASPFDFAKTLSFLKGSRAIASEGEAANDTLLKALRVRGETVAFCLKDTGTVEAPKLKGTLYAASPLTPELKAAAIRRIRFFLSLDDELGPFYALGRLDDAFAPVIDRLYGYHQVKFPTPFECACWALITQRTPNAFAYKTRKRLIHALGSYLTIGDRRYGSFPDAAQLLAAEPEDILKATNNLRKTERLLAVAEDFMTADEAFLRCGPYDEVKRWLKRLKGIGEWSAEFILLRGLGRMERTPWSDTGLLEAASLCYAEGLDLHPQHVRQIAELYREWQGYWLHYLKVAYWG